MQEILSRIEVYNVTGYMINNRSGFIDTNMIFSALSYISPFYFELSPRILGLPNIRMNFLMKTTVLL